MADKVKFKQIGKQYISETIEDRLLAISTYLTNDQMDLAAQEFEALIKEIRNVSRAINDVDKSKKS